MLIHRESGDKVVRGVVRPEERSNRIISKAMIEWRRRCFLPDFLAEVAFTIRIVLIRATTANRKLPSKWSGHFALSGC